jgi:hypothetical protein
MDKLPIFRTDDQQHRLWNLFIAWHTDSAPNSLGGGSEPTSPKLKVPSLHQQVGARCKDTGRGQRDYNRLLRKSGAKSGAAAQTAYDAQLLLHPCVISALQVAPFTAV